MTNAITYSHCLQRKEPDEDDLPMEELDILMLQLQHVLTEQQLQKWVNLFL